MTEKIKLTVEVTKELDFGAKSEEEISFGDFKFKITKVNGQNCHFLNMLLVFLMGSTDIIMSLSTILSRVVNKSLQIQIIFVTAENRTHPGPLPAKRERYPLSTVPCAARVVLISRN